MTDQEQPQEETQPQVEANTDGTESPTTNDTDTSSTNTPEPQTHEHVYRTENDTCECGAVFKKEAKPKCQNCEVPNPSMSVNEDSTCTVCGRDTTQPIVEPITNEQIEEQKQPKQEAHPNLNAGNNNEENKWAEKWKTKEERIVACEQYCAYLRQGRSKKFYPDADENTIKRYMEKYPEEFRTEKITDAERKGLSNLELSLMNASLGKVPNANATLLIWLSKNKLGMRDKFDVTSDGKAMPTPIAGGLATASQADVHPDNSNKETV